MELQFRKSNTHDSMINFWIVNWNEKCWLTRFTLSWFFKNCNEIVAHLREVGKIRGSDDFNRTLFVQTMFYEVKNSGETYSVNCLFKYVSCYFESLRRSIGKINFVWNYTNLHGWHITVESRKQHSSIYTYMRVCFYLKSLCGHKNFFCLNSLGCNNVWSSTGKRGAARGRQSNVLFTESYQIRDDEAIWRTQFIHSLLSKFNCC